MVSGILIGSLQPFPERFRYGKVEGYVRKYENLLISSSLLETSLWILGSGSHWGTMFLSQMMYPQFPAHTLASVGSVTFYLRCAVRVSGTRSKCRFAIPSLICLHCLVLHQVQCSHYLFPRKGCYPSANTILQPTKQAIKWASKRARDICQR